MKQNEITDNLTESKIFKKIKRVFFFTLTFFFLFNLTGSLFCQDSQSRRVVFETVKINGDAIPEELWDDLVFSAEDSITFRFSLKADGGEKSRFRFRIDIRTSNDSSFRLQWQPVISYKGLYEGNYRIKVSAFDPRSRWTADPAVLYFRVDDKEAALRKEVSELKERLNQRNTADTVRVTDEKKSFSFDLISILIGIFAGILFFIIIYFAFLRKKTAKEKSSTYMETFKMETTPEETVPKEKYNKVIAENSNLKAEISSLRGQIDGLNARSEELSNQNKDLKEQMDRIEKSRDEIEELQKQKDDLFAVIIHDIKNPASLIKSLVDLLRSYDLTAVEQQEVMNDIFETTTKIVNLSQEVSRILALEGTKLTLKLENEQINDIIKDVVRRNDVHAKKKNISILLDLDENLPGVEMDVQKIDEVIDNLISNGIKFSPEGTKVRVKSAKELKRVVVEVSDNGQGLSEEDVQSAFQRGTRLSAKPTGGETSSGFGLWIVKKLIEAHQGKVWVKSVLGKGSTFALSLPFKQEKD